MDWTNKWSYHFMWLTKGRLFGQKGYANNQKKFVEIWIAKNTFGWVGPSVAMVGYGL